MHTRHTIQSARPTNINTPHKLNADTVLAHFLRRHTHEPAPPIHSQILHTHTLSSIHSTRSLKPNTHTSA